MGENPGNSPK